MAVHRHVCKWHAKHAKSRQNNKKIPNIRKIGGGMPSIVATFFAYYTGNASREKNAQNDQRPVDHLADNVYISVSRKQQTTKRR